MHDHAFQDLRIAAAHLANETLAIGQPGQPPTMEQAGQWQDFWLSRIVSGQTVLLTATLTVTGPDGRVKSQFTSPGGTVADVSMTVDDTADIAIAETDDHGDVTSDVLSFTGSDGGTVLTLTPGADGKSCHVVPAAEGTASVTASDPSAPDAAAFVANFTVGAGATSSLQGTVTVNTGANAVPPAG